MVREWARVVEVRGIMLLMAGTISLTEVSSAIGTHQRPLQGEERAYRGESMVPIIAKTRVSFRRGAKLKKGPTKQNQCKFETCGDLRPVAVELRWTIELWLSCFE